MNVTTTVGITATDSVTIRSSVDGFATVFRTGDRATSENAYILGTPAHRADFLRRLSVAASDAADQLTADTAVAS